MIELETFTVEQGLKLKGTMKIADEVLDPYALKYSMERMKDNFSSMLILEATALYHYARFDGDEDVSMTTDVLEFEIITRPKKMIDYFLVGLRIKVQSLYEWITAPKFGKSPNLPWKLGWNERQKLWERLLKATPKWLHPHYETFSVVNSKAWSHTIKRVQESLFAQIHLLRKYGIEPQAVMVCPELFHKLVTIPRPGDLQYSVSIGHPILFAELPVIVCNELKWGAMVV